MVSQLGIEIFIITFSVLKGGILMARTDASINKETLALICSQIGVSIAFLWLIKRDGNSNQHVYTPTGEAE
jgi:hypothetical protein